MSIDFDAKRWERVKTDSAKWWAGELKRPLISAAMKGRTPTRERPDGPWHYFTSFYGSDYPPEKIVDWFEYNCESTYYWGDSFPMANPYYGAGALAAFLGSQVENGSGTTWFYPAEVKAAKDLSFKLNPDNPWYRMVLSVYRAAQARFQGMVQLNMTDLGGGADIISAFRPGENLLLDLYDCPEEIERLMWEVHGAWWEAYETIAKTANLNPGYTAWADIFSEEPYYMLQCDFCYMISPEMFERFVLPELSASCKRLKNAFYHLDGVGQLPHLDMLLSIPELKGVQWIPGSGTPSFAHWPEVYKKIRKAGKLIQLFVDQEYGWDIIDVIADQLGSAEGIILLGTGDMRSPSQAEPAKIEKLLDRYGCL